MYHQKVFEECEPPSLSEQEQAIYRTLADVLASQIFLL